MTAIPKDLMVTARVGTGLEFANPPANVTHGRKRLIHPRKRHSPPQNVHGRAPASGETSHAESDRPTRPSIQRKIGR